MQFSHLFDLGSDVFSFVDQMLVVLSRSPIRQVRSVLERKVSLGPGQTLLLVGESLLQQLSRYCHPPTKFKRIRFAEFEILFTDRIYTETNSFKKRYLT